MGRPKKPGGSVEHHIRLSTELSWKLEILLTNPVTGKMPYGALSSLVESQLHRWFAEQRQLASSTTVVYDFFCQNCPHSWQQEALPTAHISCPQCNCNVLKYFDPRFPTNTQHWNQP